jgi:hypothetical protein
MAEIFEFPLRVRYKGEIPPLLAGALGRPAPLRRE